MPLELELIIEPEELEAALGHPELLVAALGPAETYRRLHVPGAIHIDPSELVCGIPPASGKLPAVEQLNALFSRIGYDPELHIVAYDDEGGGWAGRFIWTLDVIGHRRYSYLNGGLHAWYREGHAVEDGIETRAPSAVKLAIDKAVIAELEEVMAALENPKVKIWDARAPEEYHGAKVTAARGGHIPGAVNLDWLETMDRKRNLRLLPLEELRRKLAALGIAEGHEIITHCQTHHRSGLTYLVAKALGFKARAYDGSWSEWGNRADTPVES